MTTVAAPIEDTRLERRWLVWTGRVLSVLPVLMLAMGATMAFAGSPQVVAAFTEHYGYPRGVLLGIAVAEIACAALYAIPSTAVLGAILMTGYLGGAVATHVRAGESFLIPVALGVLAWVALYLRDPRLRVLVPLRRSTRVR